METFSALLAICAGNSPVTGEFPAQRPVTRSFDVFFDLRLITGWVNNIEAGDLRCHRAHYDVIVMWVTLDCPRACEINMKEIGYYQNTTKRYLCSRFLGCTYKGMMFICVVVEFMAKRCCYDANIDYTRKLYLLLWFMYSSVSKADMFCVFLYIKEKKHFSFW